MSDPRSIIVVSDLHCGSRMGLCPDTGAALDGGGRYAVSGVQRKMWAHWLEFCNEWLPRVTKNEPFILLVNGDALDGAHHGTTETISNNLADQNAIAYECLKPLVDASAEYLHVRGTEAHVGPAGAEEERLARRLGAKPDADGNFARWELWADLQGCLVNATHHIGATGSSSYEPTAIGKELVESFVESGRWGDKSPQVIVRSHRHRYGEWRLFGDRGMIISLTTPAWQLKTGYSWRLPGARLSQPQLGGVLIRVGDEELHTRAMVWPMARSRTESFGA